MTETPSQPQAEVGSNNGTGYVAYPDGAVNVGGTRSWRNNNPGNIEAGHFADDHGAIGSDGRFAIFPDEATGRDALTDLLQTPGYQSLSVQDALTRYAPPDENDTTSYIDDVCQRTGIDPAAPMSSLNDDQLGDLVDAIQRHEGWRQGDAYPPDGTDAPDWVEDVRQTPQETGPGIGQTR